MGVRNLIAGVSAMAKDLWNFGAGKSVDRDRAEQLRQREIETLMSLYMGEQGKVLAADIRDNYQADAAELLQQPITYNLMRRVVDKRAMLYKEPPVFDSQNDALVESISWDGASAFWKQGDRLSELAGYAFVLADWDDKRKRIQPIVYPADRVRFEWADISAGTLARVELLSYDDEGKRIITRWTATEFSIVDEGGKDITDDALKAKGAEPNPNRENPFGVIPGTIMRPRVPLVGEPLGNPMSDLGRLQRTLNQKFTELQLLTKRQAHSVTVVKGQPVTADGKLAVGLSSVVRFEQGVEGAQSAFEYATPSPKIQELQDSILQLVSHIAFLYDLAGQWNLDGQQTSGVALKIRNADLEETRRDKEESHRFFWSDFAEVCEAVRAKRTGGKPGKVDDFSVEFCDPTVYDDPTEERARIQWELERFMLSPAEAYLELYDDVEGDDGDARLSAADAKVKANAAAWRALQAPARTMPDLGTLNLSR